ncbi:DUF4238 domain-containing protein [Pseudomonas aeruginosa]|uniref:DUF4238 domain-containing protein n=1 Tax=Pseudomonas aeruginosa TaxID=287 RepID=UPI00376EA71E|nr:DUF4238 domain-containing protein [Pseudomonas aeruginosa]
MSKQQLRTDNHYVPKLYMKQWASNGKILTYRLLVPNDHYPMWKDHTLKGIAYHKHLYTYFSDHEETDEFERWLDREFEQPAEEALRRVVHELPLKPEHWRRLARFSIAQDVRTPARLREFTRRQNETLPALINEVLERTINRLEQAAARNESPSGVKTLSAGYSPIKLSIEKQPDGSGKILAETTIGRRLWIWQMTHLLTETIELLPTHRWTILHAPTGMSWPTSDNPLVRLNFQDDRDYNFDGGWGVKNGDILLPLSPKHLLYTSIGNKPPQRGTTLSAPLFQILRKIIIEHADRYIFSRTPDDIHLIRPRLVCPHTYKKEQAAWQDWHHKQGCVETNRP